MRQIPPPHLCDIERTPHFREGFTTATTTKLMNFNYLMIEDRSKVIGFMAWNEIPEDDDLLVMFTKS